MSHKRVAYLTMEESGDYSTDFDLSFGPMAALGWAVDAVTWRNSDIEWNDYDAVYLCTAWDYPQHFDEFALVLSRIEDSSAVLVNEASSVRWNMRKSYLRDLESRGVDIVPSLWLSDIEGVDTASWFTTHQADALIIKPEVGASALDTFVLRQPLSEETLALLLAAFRQRNFLVQPFVDGVCREGEFSLFFFAGEFSHAVLKTPSTGDFRSQEEFGANIQSIQPEAKLRAAADKVVALLRPQPVYARVDLVRGDDGRFLLMELELVEPSLYFCMDNAAPARFAAAFDQHIREQSQ